MVWSNDSQDSTGAPYDARTGIVRAPQGNLQCFSYPTGPVRGPCGTCKGAVRHSCGHVRELIQPKLTKIPHGRRICLYWDRTGPLRSPHGLFTCCLGSQNPYGAPKFIMHAWKLYGSRTGRQNCTAPHGARAGPVSGHTIFVQKQPGNSPYGARECDVTGALVTHLGEQRAVGKSNILMRGYLFFSLSQVGPIHTREQHSSWMIQIWRTIQINDGSIQNWWHNIANHLV